METEDAWISLFLCDVFCDLILSGSGLRLFDSFVSSVEYVAV